MVKYMRTHDPILVEKFMNPFLSFCLFENRGYVTKNGYLNLFFKNILCCEKTTLTTTSYYLVPFIHRNHPSLEHKCSTSALKCESCLANDEMSSTHGFFLTSENFTQKQNSKFKKEVILVGFQLPEVREVKVKITRFVYFCSQKYIEG